MPASPRFEVLLKNLLRAKAIRYHHDGAFREEMGQKRGKKRLRSRTDGFQRQHFPLLQSLSQGLHSGSGHTTGKTSPADSADRSVVNPLKVAAAPGPVKGIHRQI